MNLTKRIAASFLLLQFITMFFLWTLSVFNATTERLFALFLSIDLISFAVISYLYRTAKMGDNVNRLWIILGSGIIVILLFASLILQ
jgi:hypothetical protein